MTPATIIRAAAAEGVDLTISPTGTINALGHQDAIDRWVLVIREHKASIIAALKVGAGDTPNHTAFDNRLDAVIRKLRDEGGLLYATEVYDDGESETVILSLAIRDKGACELRIPKSRYDAFKLLELIERHTTKETLQ